PYITIWIQNNYNSAHSVPTTIGVIGTLTLGTWASIFWIYHRIRAVHAVSTSSTEAINASTIAPMVSAASGPVALFEKLKATCIFFFTLIRTIHGVVTRLIHAIWTATGYLGPIVSIFANGNREVVFFFSFMSFLYILFQRQRNSSTKPVTPDVSHPKHPQSPQIVNVNINTNTSHATVTTTSREGEATHKPSDAQASKLHSSWLSQIIASFPLVSILHGSVDSNSNMSSSRTFQRIFLKTVTYDNNRQGILDIILPRLMKTPFDRELYLDAIYNNAANDSSPEFLDKLRDQPMVSVRDFKVSFLTTSTPHSSVTSNKRTQQLWLNSYPIVDDVQDFKYFLMELSRKYYLILQPFDKTIDFLIHLGCLQSLKNPQDLLGLIEETQSEDINDFALKLLKLASSNSDVLKRFYPTRKKVFDSKSDSSPRYMITNASTNKNPEKPRHPSAPSKVPTTKNLDKFRHPP
ncbi:hypothetical protein WICPIJ_005169, partial [Wickerhamomyces pijperi]